ncbi:MAG: RidA family protein [Ferrovum sp.]|nr:RidA family protein [Ferrovum sp.]NDU87540.1 RidA family protein [Ferrovum sp.]
MPKIIIATPHAPGAIGTYSQAVCVQDTVYLSGQIGLNPKTMMLEEGIDAQIKRVLSNLQAVTEAAGGNLNDLVRVTVYLTDLAHFSKVNDAMAQVFTAPYPARAAVGVASLPRGALVEMDGIMVLSELERVKGIEPSS